ncbi:MAG: hypothetical protein Kow0037_00780 [Calditrichia bacterium]
MAKKQLYFNDAERLYVVEQLTLAEIASRIPVAERTLRLWKEEGDWGRKRLQYLQGKKAFHEELYQFARKLMKSIQEDLEAGKKVDPGRMYAFTRMLPLITKIKDYEDQLLQPENDKDNLPAKGLTDDILQIIEKEVLGIH